MKQLKITTFVAAVALVTMINVPSLAVADETSEFKANLDGYQETPQAISTAGNGKFEAKISDDETQIEIELSYRDLEGGNPTAAHIHLGRPGVTGCVIIPLCGGSKPACPVSPGTVEATLTAADVVDCLEGGIAAGELDEVIAAMRARATYVNVHNATYPSGEIRGAIRRKEKD